MASEVLDHAQLMANVAAYHDAQWEAQRAQYRRVLEQITAASLRGQRFCSITVDRTFGWEPDLTTLACKLGPRFTCRYTLEHDRAGLCRGQHRGKFGPACPGRLTVTF